MPTARGTAATILLFVHAAAVHAFTAAPQPRSSHAAVAPRAGAAPTASIFVDTTNLLASLIPGGVDYDNTGSGFWDRAGSGASGDIATVGFWALGFPTILCLFFYKDNILSIFEPPVERDPPPGWKKVPSRSRPGEFSFKGPDGQVYDRIPNSAFDL